jgi:hypothetical protein
VTLTLKDTGTISLFGGQSDVTLGVTDAIVGAVRSKTWSVRMTSAAALSMALPACDAVIVHAPGERIVIVAPLNPLELHAPDAVNVTGLPDAPPVARTVNGASP